MVRGKNILLIAGALILLMISCGKAKPPAQRGGAVPVTAYTVQLKNIVYYDSYPATVEALNETELHSEVSGYVTGIFFKEGSQVAKGQRLYEIDRTKYKAALDQAKANVGIAEANLDKAQRDVDRYTALNQQNAIAKQVYDDAITSLENMKMQLQAAKSALVNAETDYNYSLITAPFSGTIGFSSVKLGAFIVPGQTLLTTVSSNDPVGVDLVVDEKAIPVFTALRAREAKEPVREDPDSTFRLVLPDKINYRYNGKISVIDRAVDSQAGTIRIRIVFPNKDAELKPGMNCEVRVLNNSSGQKLTIPYKAVVEQMGEYFVYRIDSGKVKQVKIEPGLSMVESIEVKKGLNPGDQIVLDGLQKVSNGSKVQIGSGNQGNPNAGAGKKTN